MPELLGKVSFGYDFSSISKIVYNSGDVNAIVRRNIIDEFLLCLPVGTPKPPPRNLRQRRKQEP
jgi:hypothetical protein